MRVDVQPRFRNLEALRGICALLVALIHIPWTTSVLYLPFVKNAWLFVDFFFVLSGFIITFNYMGKGNSAFDARSFVLRRFFRLYPLHLLTLLAMLAIEVVREFVIPNWTNLPPRHTFTDDFVEASFFNLFLIHALGFTTKNVLNVPSWSISTEFWMYLLFALCCVSLHSNLARIRAIIVVGVLAFIVLMVLNGSHGLATPLEYSFPRCVVSFSLGAAVWSMWSESRYQASRNAIDIYFLAVLATLLLILSCVGRNSVWNIAVLPIFAVTIYLCAIDENSRVKNLLERDSFQRLGRWSYSIYMVHAAWTSLFGFILNRYYFDKTQISEMGNRVSVPLSIGDAVTVVYIVVVVLTAAITYKYIEKPCRSFGHKLAASRQIEILPN